MWMICNSIRCINRRIIAIWTKKKDVLAGLDEDNKGYFDVGSINSVSEFFK